MIVELENQKKVDNDRWCRVTGGVIGPIGGAARGGVRGDVRGLVRRLFRGLAGVLLLILFCNAWSLLDDDRPRVGLVSVATAESVYMIVDDALGGHQYPWYDADNRRVKPATPKPGATASSIERGAVPIAKKTKKKAPNNATAGGGGGGGAATGGGDAMQTAFIVIIGVVIVMVVVALVMTFLRIESEDSEQSSRSVRSRRQSIEQLPFDLDATDGDFRSVAESAYRSGDLKKAIVYLYSHVLVTLDQNRLIRLRKGKTNRQYLNEVRNRAAVANYFRQVMVPFEAVFFGDHEMDARQFQRCWEELGKFHADVSKTAEVIIG